MTATRRIARNVGALAAARGVTAILVFITTIYLARVLGPGPYGMLAWALAYLAYFQLIPDLGLGIFGVREIARDRSRIRSLVDAVLSLRLLLASAALIVFLAGAYLFQADPLFRAVIAVQGIALFGAAVTVEWVYQGIERMGVLALRNVVVAVLVLIGALLLVQSPTDVVLASLVMAMSLSAANVWLLLKYRSDFQRPSFAFTPALWQRLVVPALPIAASLGLVAINLNLDQLMLGVFRTPEEVGLYGASYRILLAVGIPAQILLQAFLPSLSTSVGNVGAMQEGARGFARALFVIGLPAGAAGIMFAPELLSVFGPDYQPALVALTILMVHSGLQYVHMAYGNPLIAWDRQKLYMYALGAGAGMNVVLNLILIPLFGIEGAAIATLGSEVVVIGCVVAFHYSVARSIHGDLLLRALIATAVSAGLAIGARAMLDLPFFATALLLVVLYAVAVHLLRVVDYRQLWQLLPLDRR